jgi:hypothetical protein
LTFYSEEISKEQDGKRRWSEQIGYLIAKDEGIQGN